MADGDNIYQFRPRERREKNEKDKYNFEPKQPAVNLPPVIIWLVGAFIGIHLLLEIMPQTLSDEITLSFLFSPLRYDGSVTSAGIISNSFSKIISPVSYSFLHGGWQHLILNSLWLIIFGAPIAWRFGAIRFLILCFFASIFGAAGFYILDFGRNTAMIGASAITSAAMAATLRFAYTGTINNIPRTDNRRYRLPAPSMNDVWRTPTVIGLTVLWVAFSLFDIFMAATDRGNVAWQAHIFGFLSGLILFPMLDPIRKKLH